MSDSQGQTCTGSGNQSHNDIMRRDSPQELLAKILADYREDTEREEEALRECRLSIDECRLSIDECIKAIKEISSNRKQITQLAIRRLVEITQPVVCRRCRGLVHLVLLGPCSHKTCIECITFIREELDLRDNKSPCPECDMNSKVLAIDHIMNTTIDDGRRRGLESSDVEIMNELPIQERLQKMKDAIKLSEGRPKRTLRKA